MRRLSNTFMQGLRIALLAACLTWLQAAAAPVQPTRIEVQGHRGARALRPENTLPAFSYAIEAGVDTLELDIQVTKDQQLVISHDPLISQVLCLAPGGKPVGDHVRIHQLTLAEVQAYDCGSLKHPHFPRQVPVPGTFIPSLEQLFAMVAASPSSKARRVRFNIETKIVPRFPEQSVTPEEFAKLLVQVIAKHGLSDRVSVQSFDYRTLTAVHRVAAKIPLIPLIGENFPFWPGLIQATSAAVLSPMMDWLTAESVAEAHRLHVRVIPWTANEVADWDWLLAANVDGIITDDPAALIAYLKLKGRR